MKKQIIVKGKSQIYTIDTTQFQEMSQDDIAAARAPVSSLVAKLFATLGIGLILLVLIFYLAISAFNAGEGNHAYPGSDVATASYTLYVEDDTSNTDACNETTPTDVTPTNE